MDVVRTRHDDALKLIERQVTASAGDNKDRVELRVNQTVPSLPGPALRPDLQVYNHTKRTVSVVDLAIAFEEQTGDDPDTSSLTRIAALKRTKYAGIKRHLEHQGWTVQLSALVYGSLGAVAGGNLAVYTEHLGMLKCDAKRLDRHAPATKETKRIKRIKSVKTKLKGQSSDGDRGNPSHNGHR
ncbi:unnamed protein product [Peronospora farinosa]|uniref:Uncharacterized protein n=1 Tax=Peronospora farinosa TaxID=134698 RepID=A0AAV0THF4_9STRA|nr:unnamed protein product [Peronospora farinosa]